jgi:Leucine-rich repeat (LRR) protein
MQPTGSLAEFVTLVNAGPCGLEDALSAISVAASTEATTLDLQQMSLTDADFESLLPRICSLSPHLVNLNIFLNELTVLPAGLSALRGLEALHAGANPLQTIEAGTFAGMSRLRELDVGFSEALKALPASIGDCTDLRVLHAGNGRLGELPPALFACSALEELHVYGNAITKLPSEVGRLRSLRVLNIGRNCINALPSSLAQCERLESLLVYENVLTSFPPGFDRMPSLKVLNVECNPDLPVVPRDIRCAADPKSVAKFYATVQ